MQTDSSFVRSDCTVKLYTISGVYMSLSFIVYPRHTEFDLTLWLYHSLQKSDFSVFFLVCLDHHAKRFQNLFDCLVELGLCRILCDYQIKYFINI